MSDLLLEVLTQEDVKGDKEVRPFMVVQEVRFYRQTHDHIFAVRN